MSRSLSRSGQQRAAFDLAVGALLSDGVDELTASTLHTVAAVAAFESGLPELRQRMRELVLPSRVRTGPPDGASSLVVADTLPSAKALSEATLSPGGPAPARSHRPGSDGASLLRLALEGRLHWMADDTPASIGLLRQVVTQLRARDLQVAFVDVFPLLGGALIDGGLWCEAEEYLAEAITTASTARAHGLRAQSVALRAYLQALRGDAAGAAAMLRDARPDLDRDENRATRAYLLRAGGVAAASAGDREGAYRRLRALYGPDGRPLHWFHSPRAISAFAAAAAAAERAEEALPVLAAVHREVGEQPGTRMTLQLHHAEALVGDERQVEHHFRLALVNPDGERWPLERALARLHYAVWLRRRRRPLDARPLLAAALDEFARLGAADLAAQAHRELRAAGATTENAGGLDVLTAQEAQIVRMAARGLRNREIAAQLYLSPRTVGSHLYKAFPKLGISHRHQLRDIVEAQPGEIPRVQQTY
jgi:DNA-binding CsgD family transcriptional regulator